MVEFIEVSTWCKFTALILKYIKIIKTFFLIFWNGMGEKFSGKIIYIKMC